MPVRPMLLHRMALFSFRLFRKNLGKLARIFWANGLSPPLAKNCPYAYTSKYLIYLIECKSATNNILAKQKRRLHKRTIADSH